MLYRDSASFLRDANQWARLTGVLPHNHRGRPPVWVRFMYGDYLMSLADQEVRLA